MAEKEYQRLTRTRRRRGNFLEGLGRYSNVWLGKDHLLSIDSNRLSEEYKRFYFRDIQAITLVKTGRRRVWNSVLSLLMLLVVAGMTINVLSSAWALVLAIFALVLAINNILGPTCRAYLRTAVQVEELSSLSRVRRADRVMARIRPLIAAAQGELPRDEASEGIHQLFQASKNQTRFVTGPLNLSS